MFVIDSSAVKHLGDCLSDLNGTFKISIKIRSFTVEIAGDKISHRIKMVNKKVLDLGENQWIMRVHRTKNEYGLIRNLVYFVNENKEIQKNGIILEISN